MDLRRRPPLSKPPTSVAFAADDKPTAKASDALPLPLCATNAFFLTLFFSLMYFLLVRWREKIRESTPLHVVSFSEIVAIVGFVASFIYLLGFFGIDFVQAVLWRSANDDNVWVDGEGDVVTDLANAKEDSRVTPCVAAIECPSVKKSAAEVVMVSSEKDEEIVKKVVAGEIPSYSLETKLGDCKRAAAIRRMALQRITGMSLEGLPLEGLDYESILGQCCEMPVGYVQIPVGIAGPLLLDGREYMVPMATTEGCLVASTNRGCKAIYMSGGASSVLLRDAMSRAPVVRFSSAKRAAELKFVLENPMCFETLSLVFNKYVKHWKFVFNLAGSDFTF